MFKHIITTSKMLRVVIGILMLAVSNIAQINFVLASSTDEKGICSSTASLAFKACSKDRSKNYLLSKANCINVVDDIVRQECINIAKQEKRDSAEECRDVYEARDEVCYSLGEAAYDNRSYWVPENFVDPLDIGGNVDVNRYFPLVAGTSIYHAGDETITVNVTGNTKLINGVTCVTINDVVRLDGQSIEDTDDWYAQDIAGNVWYCGEISKNYELFADDVPAAAELVDLDGSWKAFRDMSLPGIIMKTNPQVDDIYRQEMSLGEAEDIAQIISNTASGLFPGDFCEEGGNDIAEFIESVCNNDCLISNEFTPLEPGNSEHKYYAPGIGLILETNVEGECVTPEGIID